jgi:hyperosmotically inducible protein
MKTMFVGRVLMAALLMGSGVAGAAAKKNVSVPQTDAEIAKQVRHEVLMYSRYTIWDDISFRVTDGHVELFGAVSQPFKKSDIQRLVRDVPGVTSVTNGLKVLPVSFHDDRIRLQVARAIYGHPAFTRYAIQAVPPIHIIVDNGRVTLTGVVNNEMEKNIAGIRAAGASLSFGPIVNNLQVEQTQKKS